MHSKSASFTPAQQKPPLDEATLVSQLNTLLVSLNLPIPLISPTDLTPSLLTAVLESLLGMRIQYMEPEDRGSNPYNSKLQSMKVFLGVLETDILKMDVGLSDLDPRRLADGEWEEITFVAELLCWIGRKMGLIKRNRSKPLDDMPLQPQFNPEPDADLALYSDAQTPKSRRRPLSPKSQLDLDAETVFQTGSTGSTHSSQRVSSTFTTTSRLPDEDNESVTSLDTVDHQDLQFLLNKNDHDEESDTLSSVSDVLSALPPFAKSQPTTTPHCIHEVPSPSPLLFSRHLPPSPSPSSPSPRRQYRRCPEHSRVSCTCDLVTSPVQSPPIRYTGYIEQVDEELEIASYELSRSMSSSSSLSSIRLSEEKRILPDLKSVKAQYARTLELMNVRARLLTQLAEINNLNSHG